MQEFLQAEYCQIFTKGKTSLVSSITSSLGRWTVLNAQKCFKFSINLYKTLGYATESSVKKREILKPPKLLMIDHTKEIVKEFANFGIITNWTSNPTLNSHFSCVFYGPLKTTKTEWKEKKEKDGLNSPESYLL